MKLGEIVRGLGIIGQEFMSLPFGAVHFSIPDLKANIANPRVLKSPNGSWVEVPVDRDTGTVIVPKGVQAEININ